MSLTSYPIMDPKLGQTPHLMVPISVCYAFETLAISPSLCMVVTRWSNYRRIGSIEAFTPHMGEAFRDITLMKHAFEITYKYFGLFP